MNPSAQIISEKSSTIISSSSVLPNSGTHVSIIKLTDQNYLAWKFQVLITIRAHGLEDHIAENLVPPDQFLPQESDKEGPKKN